VNTLHDTLRIATYNIHKGVQGVGPRQRLEIHNLGHAVEQIDADIICLQEVRKLHRRQQQYFTHWPDLPQAEFLAPEGYEAIYRTNAVTRHGEHGNALSVALAGAWRTAHEDMSDHRFEQRGLLHVEVDVQGRVVHVIVVHFGLLPASRMRARSSNLGRYIEREVPARRGAGGGGRLQRLGHAHPAHPAWHRDALVRHRALSHLSFAAAGGPAGPDLCRAASGHCTCTCPVAGSGDGCPITCR
jgi:hypothetical protein